MQRGRTALAVCTLLGAAACAPISGFRPADALMPGGPQTELGMGGAMQGARRYVDERTQAAGQLWITRRLGKRVSLSGMGAFDLGAAAAGGGLRYDVLRGRRGALGVEGELGFAWGALTLPASLRLPGGAQLYTGPRLGTRGVLWAVDLPIGVSAPLAPGWLLRAEYASSWAELRNYNHRHMIGLALARQF